MDNNQNTAKAMFSNAFKKAIGISPKDFILKRAEEADKQNPTKE